MAELLFPRCRCAREGERVRLGLDLAVPDRLLPHARDGPSGIWLGSSQVRRCASATRRAPDSGPWGSSRLARVSSRTRFSTVATASAALWSPSVMYPIVAPELVTKSASAEIPRSLSTSRARAVYGTFAPGATTRAL